MSKKAVKPLFYYHFTGVAAGILMASLSAPLAALPALASEPAMPLPSTEPVLTGPVQMAPIVPDQDPAPVGATPPSVKPAPAPTQAPALGDGFQSWLEDFKDRQQAANNFEASFLEQNLNDLSFLPRVIELDRRQPEGTLTHAEYLRRVVSAQRISQGQAQFQEHRAALAEVEQAYGVPAEIITALWGIETSYGAITGGFRVIDALASLSYEGRRRSFFETELVNLLRIVQEEQRSPDDFLGSWAGAMGQSQFMPSSFLAYAVDYDGDGKRDIWGTTIDVFASAANYLKQSGWRDDQRWGRAVELPAGFDRQLVTGKVTKSLEAWSKRGVTLPGGQALPTAGPDFMARLIQPDGAGGPAFLAYDNFDVILRWNRSNYFATAVGILSDRLAETNR
ncbi:MAG: lytic murein transglycosylase [Pseudomonadota bacterium]